MAVVAQAERVVELGRLGLSEALIRLSGGERLHALFDYRCQGPPFYSYHGAGCPDGPALLPLWDSADSVTGVWVRDRRLEFIKFSIEAPAEHVVLARTEQGPAERSHRILGTASRQPTSPTPLPRTLGIQTCSSCRDARCPSG